MDKVDRTTMSHIHAIRALGWMWGEMVLRRRRGRAEEPYNAKQINRAQSLRVLLGLFQWRYLLTPVGITSEEAFARHKGGFVVNHVKQLHIFGIRVARWCIGELKWAGDEVTPERRELEAQLRHEWTLAQEEGEEHKSEAKRGARIVLESLAYNLKVDLMGPDGEEEDEDDDEGEEQADAEAYRELLEQFEFPAEECGDRKVLKLTAEEAVELLAKEEGQPD